MVFNMSPIPEPSISSYLTDLWREQLLHGCTHDLLVFRKDSASCHVLILQNYRLLGLKFPPCWLCLQLKYSWQRNSYSSFAWYGISCRCWNLGELVPLTKYKAVVIHEENKPFGITRAWISTCKDIWLYTTRLRSHTLFIFYAAESTSYVFVSPSEVHLYSQPLPPAFPLPHCFHWPLIHHTAFLWSPGCHSSDPCSLCAPVILDLRGLYGGLPTPTDRRRQRLRGAKSMCLLPPTPGSYHEVIYKGMSSSGLKIHLKTHPQWCQRTFDLDPMYYSE